MTLNELLNQLDYDKLRFDYEMIMKFRMKDSPFTKAKFVMNFTKYDSELGKEIRSRKKVRSAFVEQWAKGLSREEMKSLLKHNIEVSPSHALSTLVGVMDRGKDRDSIIKYMECNGITRIKGMSTAEWLSLIPLSISTYFFLDGAVAFEFGTAFMGFMGVIVSSLPHAFRQRNLTSDYLICIHDYISRTHEEPGLLLVQDKRQLDDE